MAAMVPSKMRQQVRSDSHMFSTSDDNVLMKQIQATHSPHGHVFNMKPFLNVIEDIMRRATSTIPGTAIACVIENRVKLDAMDEKALKNGFSDTLEHLAYTINKTSCEISCKCSGGSDAHTNTVALFNTLSGFSWDNKVVIALAAFAVNYGEFWLFAQLYVTNPLAKSVALLKQLPDVLERTDVLKIKFEALTTLIKAMLDVTKCIVELKELPSQYITLDMPEMLTAAAHTPAAVYWTIRSAVACASQIMNLFGMGHESLGSKTEDWELSSLAHKVYNIHSHLKEQLALCYQHIEEKRHIEAYPTLSLLETSHIDNTRILKALIYAKEDQLPLFDGSTKEQVNTDVLKRKNVLLLISDLDLPHVELCILREIFQESRQQGTRMESQYEMVWLPVVDRSISWNDEKQKKFDDLRASMPWYSYHPSLLDLALIRFIKEEWHFKKKPLLVVLDSRGRVVNPNAIHMMWIWRSLAFPFTSSKEEALWKQQTAWSMGLLADSIDEQIVNWLTGGKYICLYGGEDLVWIRKFTAEAKAVAKEANISLELLYVGKSNSGEKVRKNTAIMTEKLSHIMTENLIRFFWARLESMLFSKMQLGKSVDNDPIMQEILTVLSLDRSNEGWAVVGRGPGMAKAKANTILESLTQFPQWKERAQEIGFVPALNEDIRGLHMATMVPSKTQRQQVRSDRHMLSASDDNAMIKQIQATHSPEGRDFDMKPFLNVIEDIMHRATATIPNIGIAIASVFQNQPQLDAMDEKTLHNGFCDTLELLAYTINITSREISCKCSGGWNAHTNTMELFNTLSGYSWDNKVVIALAAFAVNYGKFWLFAQLYVTNPLAKSVALLTQLPDVLERTDVLKIKFEALTTLIKAMLDVTKCIVELKELPSQYITLDMPEMLTAAAHTPAAVYWTIRSAVACASQIMNLIGMGHESLGSKTEAWELSSLTHKVSNIHSHLKKQLALCYEHIEEKRHIEGYQTLVPLFETAHIDNMKILKALIYAKEDQLPLVDGSNRKRVKINVLKRKNVLLLISDLDFPRDEFSTLVEIFLESRQTRAESPYKELPRAKSRHQEVIMAKIRYEVVWLPVVDRSISWNDEKQKTFDALQATMPWYSVHHPSLLDPAVIKYIKEAWHFNKKPLLVVLDLQGRVVNPNAIHMMWIWRSLAFPFTSSREEALWKQETTWSMELLADSFDEQIVNRITGGKYICLYGGEDLDWIRKFTAEAKAVAKEANISLELLYVGKSNPTKKVVRNNMAIMTENLSHIMPNPVYIWFFWLRLESMWHSKKQCGKSAENDPIMQEIMTVLSFDGSDQGWAVVGRGSGMAKAKADTFLKSLTQFQKWKERAQEIGFVPALNEDLHELHTQYHCNRLTLSSTTGWIPENVFCSECGRTMEKLVTYRCCIG